MKKLHTDLLLESVVGGKDRPWNEKEKKLLAIYQPIRKLEIFQIVNLMVYLLLLFPQTVSLHGWVGRLSDE